MHSHHSIIKILAFLDEGSSVTLVERSLFDSLHLGGAGGAIRDESESIRTLIKVSGVLNDTKFVLSDVHTVEHLDLPSQTLNMDEIIKIFEEPSNAII